MPRPTFPTRGRPAFALISVLALVSLAALSATAFLASARLERLASRPLADIARLEMAASTGLGLAMSVLAQAGDTTNYGLQRVISYWRTNEGEDLGYLLVGTPISPLTMAYLPAFSAAAMTNALEPGATTTHSAEVTGQGNYGSVLSNRFASQWTNGSTNNFTRLTLLGGQTSPPVAWIPIRQERRLRVGSAVTTNVTVARVAFFVQDLQGLFDAERMGGSNSRVTGTNPAEISLANLSGTALANATTASNFIASNNRALYAGTGMLTLTNGAGLPTNDLRYVATGLRSWGWMSNTNTGVDPSSFSNRVPPGIQVAASPDRAYTNAGQVKFDLNTNLTPGSVSNLIGILSSNLPNFGLRGGGMASNNYLFNIAANIVDYGDGDASPTADTNGVIPAWRGVEAIPWPNEVFTRFNLQSRTNVGNSFRFSLVVKQYVELWNLSSKSVTVVSNSLSISNNMNIAIQCSNWFGNLATVDTNNPPTVEPATNQTFILPPNSYGVVSMASRVYTITVPTNLVPAGVTNPRLTLPRLQTPPATNNRYVIYLSNAVVDASAGGRLLGGTTNLAVGDFHFISSSANFGTSLDGSSYNLAGGDPRAQLFSTLPMMAYDYTATTPGGRNRYSPASGGANIVDPRVNWPDGGNSVGNSGADIVTAPSSANANNSIAQGVQRQGNTNHWIQKAGDNGGFTNLVELGNLFDPIQWGDPNNPFHPRDSAAWMVLSGSCTNFGGAGGRNSLRIGRPEHPRFAFTNFGGNPVPNMGMSAAAMLDLFRIGSADSNSFTGGGKINLNTAPAPVLAALAGGVVLTNDAGMAGSPVNATMVNAFTQGVLRFRSLYPFYSGSQLPFISTDYGQGSWTNTWSNTAVFSTNAGAGLAGVSALNDEGREEWFSRIHGLTSVDSLNFRCYVVAQLTDTGGNPRGAPFRRFYQIYTVPDPQGPAATPPRPPFRPVVVEEGSY